MPVVSGPTVRITRRSAPTAVQLTAASSQRVVVIAGQRGSTARTAVSSVHRRYGRIATQTDRFPPRDWRESARVRSRCPPEMVIAVGKAVRSARLCHRAEHHRCARSSPRHRYEWTIVVHPATTAMRDRWGWKRHLPSESQAVIGICSAGK